MLKAANQRKTPLLKKELLTLSPGNIAEGSWSLWRWWWVRTSRANHKSMWQHFGVLRVKHQKTSLNRRPIPSTCRGGGGLCSQPISVTWHGNGWSMQHSRRVIRPAWRTATNFMFYSKFAVHNIFLYLRLGKTTYSQDRFLAIQVL